MIIKPRILLTKLINGKQLFMGSKQFWKLCLNLWSAKWLSPRLLILCYYGYQKLN